MGEILWRKGGTLHNVVDRTDNKRIYQNSSYQESKSLFSHFHQEINQNFIANDNRIPQVIPALDGFTHGTGGFDIIFENTGQSVAIVFKFQIGGDNLDVDEFLVYPKQRTTKRFNVSGFQILEKELKGNNFELFYKNFDNNKIYITTGHIVQEKRKGDGKYNLLSINNLSFSVFDERPHDLQISNLERTVLEKLYKTYKKHGQKIKWKAIDAFKELNIKNGQDISTLHDSKFINIVPDGTHEYFVITTEGIRYMDNRY